MSRKIKILFTIPNFDTAGSGKVLYDLAKGLNKNKFDVEIACKHDKGHFFKQIEALNLPIHLLDPTVPLRPYFNLLSRIKPFQQFLKDQNIDIVHSWHWSSDWSEVLASRLAKVKFIYTKKAMSWGKIHWKLRSILSHYIITVNSEMKHFFPYKSQQIIPFGVDSVYYNPNLFHKKTDLNKFKIVTVANLVAVKGLETLIKAIKRLEKPNITLEVIGDDKDEYAKRLKRIVRQFDLEDQVIFIGKQTDIRPYLVQADLYVISSKNEGMPMALVEAMAMQLPVLGSNIPGIKDVLKEFNTLLFEVENDEILSKKILMMYHKSSEERTILGMQLRAYCETHFSLNTFISTHETLYFKLAGNK